MTCSTTHPPAIVSPRTAPAAALRRPSARRRGAGAPRAASFGLASFGLAAVATLALAPRPAQACGGTFCEAGPTPMPVDQTGENILFVTTATHVEAHIQIQYEGEAQNFGWIVPVSAVPEISVGSQALFDNLLTGTVPIVQRPTVFEACADDASGCGGVRFAQSSPLGNLSPENGVESGGFGDDGGGGVELLDRGVAGAFEYVVLTGSSVDEVVAWLDLAGYQQDDDAPPILAEYLEEGFVFVAVKLRSGAEVHEIQPLVIRYEGDEPCVPIRLTRIAAVEDMGIRLFFLDGFRWGPKNWPHVVPNFAKLDWLNLGTNYDELITMAVDEAPMGRGFVTEYHGPRSAISEEGIYSPAWQASEFVDLPALEAVNELTQQGLISCDEEAGCTYHHPLVQGLLQRWLPAPDGVSDDEFYACVSCFAAFIDENAWDGAGFAADFAQRIVDPAVHAMGLLNTYPYVTRLYTTLSPHEMTEDPTFHAVDEDDAVVPVLSATQTNTCEGADFLEVGEDVVHFDEEGNYPFELDMPAALRIEHAMADGPFMIETDNQAQISAAIAAWNADHPLAEEPGCSLRGRGGWRGGGVLGLVFAFAWFGRRRR